MSETLHQFYQVMREDPDTDEPRLVIADWYEEQGQLERATLIRLQLERANLPSWDVRAVHLELKERALLHASEAEWRAELPQAEGVRWGRFERGFVRKLAFDNLVVLNAHLEACRAACPIFGMVIRWPRLEDRPALAAIDELRELTVVGTQMQPEDVQWLADSPLLSTVRTLNLVETQIDADALGHLLASPHLSQLQALRVPLHNFGNAGVDLLVQADLPALVDLDLSVATEDECGSGGRYEPTMDVLGAAALAAWSGLAKLHTLNLTGNQLGADGLHTLLASPHIASLKTLRLKSIADWEYEDGDGKADVLPAFQHAAKGLQLDELDIGETDVNAGAARILADAPALSQLKVLGLDRAQGGDGLEQLIQSTWFDSLCVLRASDGQADLLAAVFARAPEKLHTLKMQSNYYWSRIETLAETLASLPPLASLLQLDVGDVGIDDGQLEKLGKVPSLPNLLTLRLVDEDEDIDISEESAAAFAKSPLGAQLTSLNMGIEEHDRLPPPVPIEMGRGYYTGPLRYL